MDLLYPKHLKTELFFMAQMKPQLSKHMFMLSIKRCTLCSNFYQRLAGGCWFSLSTLSIKRSAAI